MHIWIKWEEIRKVLWLRWDFKEDVVYFSPKSNIFEEKKAIKTVLHVSSEIIFSRSKGSSQGCHLYQYWILSRKELLENAWEWLSSAQSLQQFIRKTQKIIRRIVYFMRTSRTSIFAGQPGGCKANRDRNLWRWPMQRHVGELQMYKQIVILNE